MPEQMPTVTDGERERLSAALAKASSAMLTLWDILSRLDDKECNELYEKLEFGFWVPAIKLRERLNIPYDWTTISSDGKRVIYK